MHTQHRHIAVLMGGVSGEHDVSLSSGRGVVDALTRAGHRALPVVIGRDGRWQLGSEPFRDTFEALVHLRDARVDCVFIALHGPFGEDGRMQGMLDLLGFPYTGSGCAASALSMDKVRSKAVVQAQGVPVAPHVAFDAALWTLRPDEVVAAIAKDTGYPCVVKGANQGSSIGIEMVDSAEGLRMAVEQVFQVDEYILAEPLLQGVELTCGVLDAEPDGRIRGLPVTEIRPKARFFDYTAKYTPGATDEITPAEIPGSATASVQSLSVLVHEVLGCRGWSRSDFILTEGGPVWIEVNTVPGLTPTSLYPQACAADGISYEQMVCLFVEAAIRERTARKE